jgi:voltage-dependent potassium channel beta subunit
MEYVNLGDSGLKVSRVALGSWLTYGSSVDAGAAESCVKAALDEGVIFIDTADIYAYGKAETVLGKALQGVARPDYVLATKAFWPLSSNPNNRGLSRKHLFESVHASLGRLRTDYIDLYQCHRYDEETPLDETVRAMADLMMQGKILYWGVSCWTAAQLLDACHLADGLGCARPISNQPQYSLLCRDIEQEVIPLCEREGVGQVVWSPLAQGVLTGKYTGGKAPRDSRGADEKRNGFMQEHLQPDVLGRVDQMVVIARELDVSPAQLALAWCLRDESVASVIVGATRPEQVRDNVAAAGLELDDHVLERLETLFPGPPPMPQL